MGVLGRDSLPTIEIKVRDHDKGKFGQGPIVVVGRRCLDVLVAGNHTTGKGPGLIRRRVVSRSPLGVARQTPRMVEVIHRGRKSRLQLRERTSPRQLGDAWHQYRRRVVRVPQPAQRQAGKGSSAEHRSSPIHVPTPLGTTTPGGEA
jgi:hypothetical protein